MLNIRRVDHEASSTHCWRVTVQRRARVFVRDFSDGRLGGSQRAFEAAQLYRDTLIKAHPPLSMPDYCAILKKNNRSGVSGVIRVDRVELNEGRPERKLYWRPSGRSARVELSTEGSPFSSMARREPIRGR